MNEVLEKYFKKLEIDNSLKNYIDFFSVSTWDRISFIRNTAGFKIYETTITQNLLYSISQIVSNKNSNFHMYESTNEKANGNDIEIFIETSKGFILFPTQAKIIYKDEKYGSIKHKVNNIYQIKNLLDYSINLKGLPLYLFYNYCKNSRKLYDVSSILKNDIEIYGCSISNALKIYEEYFLDRLAIKSIGFYDLILTNSYPLSILCQDDSTYLKISKTYNLKFYSYDVINNDKNWRNMLLKTGLGYANTPNLKITEVKNQFYSKNEGFNPKFRIVISKNTYSKLYNIYGLS